MSLELEKFFIGALLFLTVGGALIGGMASLYDTYNPSGDPLRTCTDSSVFNSSIALDAAEESDEAINSLSESEGSTLGTLSGLVGGALSVAKTMQATSKNLMSNANSAPSCITETYGLSEKDNFPYLGVIAAVLTVLIVFAIGRILIFKG